MQTTFAYPPDVPAILIARLFDAPRALVWQAMSAPRRIERWWGPRRYTTKVREMDMRPGGHWRIINAQAGGEEFEFFGTYYLVEAPRRIVQTFSFRDFTPSVETMTLEEAGDKTQFSVVAVFAGMADREGMRASDMESGASETNERLDEVLKSL